MLDEPLTSPDPSTSSADTESAKGGSEAPANSKHPQEQAGPTETAGTTGSNGARSEETKATIKTDSNPTPKESSTLGLSGGQMFMMFLTLIGIVLVAQGLRKKNSKNIPSEFAELDAIRRELASKYPIDPPKPKAPAVPVPSQQMAADLQALGDRLAAQLDARAARIETLLEQADLRMAELKLLASQSGDAPIARIGGGGNGGGGNAVAHESARSPLRLENQVDPLQRRVYDLADAGMSPIEIARAVQQPTGHVELMLNLRATARSAAR